MGYTVIHAGNGKVAINTFGGRAKKTNRKKTNLRGRHSGRVELHHGRLVCCSRVYVYELM